MQNYRFLIEYDGTRYNGWQRLKGNDNTIQGKLETVLSRMTGQEVQLTGAGRTDAGVHARGQVANAFLETDLSGDEIRAYMNHYLGSLTATTTAQEKRRRSLNGNSCTTRRKSRILKECGRRQPSLQEAMTSDPSAATGI